MEIDSKSQQPYIESIDGLRAVAVMMVLFFHVGFAWFPGGFVGVDLFFVISGFLITRNIVNQLTLKKFSLKYFYVNRVARLFPALFATIIATLLTGSVLLGTTDFLTLTDSTLAATFSVSNFYFWNTLGYFETASGTLPLLHTWSLGAEEQFYLVWPLILLFAFSRASQIKLANFIAGLFIISLYLTFTLEIVDREAVFYLVPFRVQQFAFGGLLALTGPLVSSRYHNVTFILALLFYIGLGFLVDGRITNYGINFLNTTIAAGLLLWSANSSLANALLCNRQLLWIGRRSYSIYLAHWPIIVFWQLVSLNTLSLVTSIAQILVSILAGTILFELVEQKFRLSARSSKADIENSTYAAISLASISVLISAIVILTNGVPQRLSDEIRLAEANYETLSVETDNILNRDECLIITSGQIRNNYNKESCAPATEGKRSYLVLGDSWAANSYLMLIHAYPEIEFGLLSVPGCLLRAPSEFPDDAPQDCTSHFQYAFDELLDSGEYEGVVVSSNWDPPYSDVLNLEEFLKAKGLRVIVLTDYMIFEQHIPSQIFSAVRMDAIIERITFLSRQKVPVLMNEAITERIARPDYFSMIGIQCQVTCVVIDEGQNILYEDTNHLTIAGGRIFGERMRNTYPDLF